MFKTSHADLFFISGDLRLGQGASACSPANCADAFALVCIVTPWGGNKAEFSPCLPTDPAAGEGYSIGSQKIAVAERSV